MSIFAEILNILPKNLQDDLQVKVASKSVQPCSTIEQIRLYEWVVLFCGDEVNNRKIEDNIGTALMKKLTKSFKDAKANEADSDKEPDHLADVVASILDNVEISTNEAPQEGDGVDNQESLSSIKIHTFALIDSFEHGHKLLEKANITKSRKQKKNRIACHIHLQLH